MDSDLMKQTPLNNSHITEIDTDFIALAFDDYKEILSKNNYAKSKSQWVEQRYMLFDFLAKFLNKNEFFRLFLIWNIKQQTATKQAVENSSNPYETAKKTTDNGDYFGDLLVLNGENKNNALQLLSNFNNLTFSLRKVSEIFGIVQSQFYPNNINDALHNKYIDWKMFNQMVFNSSEIVISSIENFYQVFIAVLNYHLASNVSKQEQLNIKAIIIKNFVPYEEKNFKIIYNFVKWLRKDIDYIMIPPIKMDVFSDYKAFGNILDFEKWYNDTKQDAKNKFPTWKELQEGKNYVNEYWVYFNEPNELLINALDGLAYLCKVKHNVKSSDLQEISNSTTSTKQGWFYESVISKSTFIELAVFLNNASLSMKKFDVFNDFHWVSQKDMHYVAYNLAPDYLWCAINPYKDDFVKDKIWYEEFSKEER